MFEGASPRGRKLWPKAIHVAMRFHDLRHTFATELLRRGVDVHRVQRLMRHSDVRLTTGTYGHLLVEDLRASVDAHSPHMPAPAANPNRRPAGNSAPTEPQAQAAGAGPLSADFGKFLERSEVKLERETGFEPATLSLGS